VTACGYFRDCPRFFMMKRTLRRIPSLLYCPGFFRMVKSVLIYLTRAASISTDKGRSRLVGYRQKGLPAASMTVLPNLLKPDRAEYGFGAQGKVEPWAGIFFLAHSARSSSQNGALFRERYTSGPTNSKWPCHAPSVNHRVSFKLAR